MHASFFLAGLAATVATATPLMAHKTSEPTTVFNRGPTFTRAPAQATPSSPLTNSTGPAPPSGSVLGNPNAVPNIVPPPDLVADLLTESSTVNRFKKLQGQIDAGKTSLVFDHNPAANPGVTPGMGGQVDLANRANFPVLTGLGISNAVVFFQPCGLNTPHIHPRATEYFTLATDSNMTTGFVLENGLTDEFTAELGIWQGTVFPQGSIHWQQNNDCKPATGVAGLSSDEPGASSIAQNFVRFTRPDVVDAALGKLPAEINASNIRDFEGALPASLAKGVKECLVRCGIEH